MINFYSRYKNLTKSERLRLWVVILALVSFIIYKTIGIAQIDYEIVDESKNEQSEPITRKVYEPYIFIHFKFIDYIEYGPEWFARKILNSKSRPEFQGMEHRLKSCKFEAHKLHIVLNKPNLQEISG